MKTTLRSLWTLLLLLVGIAVQAQSPSWRAVRAISNTGAYYSNVRAVAADGNGNLYITGSYSGTILLGNLELSYVTGQTTFVAKWNIATNTYVWAQHCGGFVNTLALSGNNIYIGGGLYGGPTIFGPYTTTYTDENAFVAKLTDNGTTGSFAWVQQFGGGSFAGVQALAVVGSSIYVTGAFNTSTANFGTYTLSNTSPGYWSLGELYVAKLADATTSASVAWVQQVAAGQVGKKGYPRGLAASGTSIYVTGSGGTSGFAAKFTDAGSFVWSKPLGGLQVYPTCLALRGDDLYVAGQFTGASASFGTTTFTQTAGSPTFSSDVFVTKLTDNGADATYGWALQAGGMSADTTAALVVTNNGVYVSGAFRSATASFGTTTLKNSASGDVADLFVSRITETATGASFAWALSAGSAGIGGAQGLAVSNNTLYTVGDVIGTSTTFGNITVPLITTNPNNPIGFVAEISDTALPLRTTSTLAEGAFYLYPNPAHGITTVRVPATAEATNATLTLLDALGRAVRTQAAVVGANSFFDLTSLPPGVYALRVQAGKSVMTQKLLVE
jgi:hypothetical protein